MKTDLAWDVMMNTSRDSKSSFSNTTSDQLHVSQLDVVGLSHGIPFVFGKRLYGAVDRIPGIFHVTTVFYHVFWLPVIPVESWIIVTNSYGYLQARNMPIPLSLKSVMVVWARIWCVFFAAIGIFTCIALFVAFIAGRAPAGDMICGLVGTSIFAAVAIGVYWLTSAASVASANKAEKLALIAGFPPDASKELLAANADKLAQAVEEDLTTTMTCPECGRILSSRARVCPRCEYRFR